MGSQSASMWATRLLRVSPPPEVADSVLLVMFCLFIKRWNIRIQTNTCTLNQSKHFPPILPNSITPDDWTKTAIESLFSDPCAIWKKTEARISASFTAFCLFHLQLWTVPEESRLLLHVWSAPPSRNWRLSLQRWLWRVRPLLSVLMRKWVALHCYVPELQCKCNVPSVNSTQKSPTCSVIKISVSSARVFSSSLCSLQNNAFEGRGVPSTLLCKHQHTHISSSAFTTKRNNCISFTDFIHSAGNPRKQPSNHRPSRAYLTHTRNTTTLDCRGNCVSSSDAMLNETWTKCNYTDCHRCIRAFIFFPLSAVFFPIDGAAGCIVSSQCLASPRVQSFLATPSSPASQERLLSTPSQSGLIFTRLRSRGRCQPWGDFFVFRSRWLVLSCSG